MILKVENGKEYLGKIKTEDLAPEVFNSVATVKVSSNDAESDYLANKIVPVNGITATVVDDSGVESLEIGMPEANANGDILKYDDTSGLWVASSLVAIEISADTTNFDKILSSSDDTIQKALDTIDDHTHNGLLPSGSDRQTLRNNAGTWEASNVLKNDGTDLYFNIENKAIDNIAYCKDAVGKVGWTPPIMIGVPSAVYKTSDEVVNNSDTLQNDDSILFSAAANGTYIVNINLMVEQEDAGASFKFRFTVPAGCVIRGSYNMYLGSGISTGVVSGVNMDLRSQQELNMGAASDYLIQINMVVENGSNQGTVRLQWAQLYAVAYDTTVKKYSNMIINKVL